MLCPSAIDVMLAKAFAAVPPRDDGVLPLAVSVAGLLSLRPRLVPVCGSAVGVGDDELRDVFEHRASAQAVMDYIASKFEPWAEDLASLALDQHERRGVAKSRRRYFSSSFASVLGPSEAPKTVVALRGSP